MDVVVVDNPSNFDHDYDHVRVGTRAVRLSRAAFARKIDVDRSTLSQILSGATDRLPRVETLEAIARSEQVSLD